MRRVDVFAIHVLNELFRDCDHRPRIPKAIVKSGDLPIEAAIHGTVTVAAVGYFGMSEYDGLLVWTRYDGRVQAQPQISAGFPRTYHATRRGIRQDQLFYAGEYLATSSDGL